MKTLAEICEQWAKQKKLKIPKRGTAAWLKLYERWIDFAFREMK